MPTPFTRRNFLLGSQALVVAASLPRASAHLAPADAASDENYWAQIRAAYTRDAKLLNFNNGGCAPAPASVMNAQLEAIR